MRNIKQLSLLNLRITLFYTTLTFLYLVKIHPPTLQSSAFKIITSVVQMELFCFTKPKTTPSPPQTHTHSLEILQLFYCFSNSLKACMSTKNYKRKFFFCQRESSHTTINSYFIGIMSRVQFQTLVENLSFLQNSHIRK